MFYTLTLNKICICITKMSDTSITVIYYSIMHVSVCTVEVVSITLISSIIKNKQ